MAQSFPQEIIDLIVDLIPAKARKPWKTPKQDTSVPDCTLVSRSFSAAARRRRFSTLIIEIQTGRNPYTTRRRLNTLLEILQDTRGPIGFVKTLKVHLDGRVNLRRDWDGLVAQIIRLFATPASRLLNLYLWCPKAPTFTAKFGPLCQLAIYDIQPKLQGLSFIDFKVPAKMLENVASLRSLVIRDMDLEDHSLDKTELRLPECIQELVIHGCLHHVRRWYQDRGQPLPQFTRVRVEMVFDLPTLGFSDLFVGSFGTLSSLELTTFRGPLCLDNRLDLGLFTNLKTIRFMFDLMERHLFHPTQDSLASVAEFLCASRMPSTLVQLEIVVFLEGHTEVPKRGFPPKQMSSLCGLNPVNLLIKHPKLKSILVFVDLSAFNVDFGRGSAKERAKLEVESSMLSNLEVAIFGPNNRLAASTSPQVKFEIEVSWKFPSPWTLYVLY